MPRSSADRTFGFREKGISRILTSSDIDEVLKAVEKLGFRLPNRKPIADLIILVTGIQETSDKSLTTFLISTEAQIQALTEIFYSEGIPQMTATQQMIDKALFDLGRSRNEILLTLRESQVRVISNLNELEKLVFLRIGE